MRESDLSLSSLNARGSSSSDISPLGHLCSASISWAWRQNLMASNASSKRIVKESGSKREANDNDEVDEYQWVVD